MLVTIDIGDLHHEARATIEALDDPDFDMRVIGMFSADLNDTFRAVAISELLISGDTDRFLHALMRSARTRLYYLQRAQRESHLDFYSATSRADGLFDALAASDFEIASEIAKQSPSEWMNEDEYEDDFLYALFIHHMLTGDASDAKAEEILKRLTHATGDRSQTRLNICTALHLNQQETFDSAFDELLGERVAQVAREREIFESTTVLEANLRVSVEALALLRLAERAGLKTQPEYLFCPELARMPMVEPFPDDGYPRLAK
jgi:hypothetical protein